MPTFTTIKSQIRTNLNDSGAISYTTTDLDDSVQDGYDDIVSQTQCIIKKVTLNWTANLSYYDLPTLVSDFMACVAIFNNINNQWLDDDRTIRDFDSFRSDWELANGTPTNWAPLNFKYIGIFPRYSTAAGTFDLYYWATAPIVVDAGTPLIATDCQNLLTKYSTADLLEQFEEFSKASPFWNMYLETLEEYRERVKNLVKSDLLIRI